MYDILTRTGTRRGERTAGRKLAARARVRPLISEVIMSFTMLPTICSKGMKC